MHDRGGRFGSSKTTAGPAPASSDASPDRLRTLPRAPPLPPGSWKPVRTLGFCLIGLVLFVAAMIYMIHEVNSGNVVLPGGVGGG